jgi:predicted N-acetyltransferase YhbS
VTADLEIHAASHDELIAAHRNVFDIWSKGRNLADHIQHRLDSPTHRRAEWFVGCVDGGVVTSLAAHPVRFCIAGENVSGIAIGSVYTTADVRGRGYAPRLIKWVEDHTRRQGTGLSMLYSDVNPDYYARQGYVLCPSWEGWRDLDGKTAGQRASHRLVAFSVEDHLPAVKKLYADDYGTLALSIARDDEYWTMMLEKFARDQFYALEAPDGAWAGYALIGRRDDNWRVIDYALADHSESLAEAFYTALETSAHATGAKRVGGWMPDSAAVRNVFALAPRSVEITMIKPLAWSGKLSDEMIADCDRICEFDHV